MCMREFWRTEGESIDMGVVDAANYGSTHARPFCIFFVHYENFPVMNSCKYFSCSRFNLFWVCFFSQLVIRLNYSLHKESDLPTHLDNLHDFHMWPCRYSQTGPCRPVAGELTEDFICLHT
jgi:hypothetical protein